MILPKGMTKRQLELLVLIFPGPIGKGMSVSQAAKELGISKRAAFYRRKHFAKRFPEAYETYLGARRIMRKHRIWVAEWNNWQPRFANKPIKNLIERMF